MTAKLTTIKLGKSSLRMTKTERATLDQYGQDVRDHLASIADHEAAIATTFVDLGRTLIAARDFLADRPTRKNEKRGQTNGFTDWYQSIGLDKAKVSRAIDSVEWSTILGNVAKKEGLTDQPTLGEGMVSALNQVANGYANPKTAKNATAKRVLKAQAKADKGLSVRDVKALNPKAKTDKTDDGKAKSTRVQHIDPGSAVDYLLGLDNADWQPFLTTAIGRSKVDDLMSTLVNVTAIADEALAQAS